MPSILIEGLTEDEREEFRVLKARGRYSSWQEMFKDICDIDVDADPEEDDT